MASRRFRRTTLCAPRLTNLLEKSAAQCMILNAPAGYGKDLARGRVASHAGLRRVVYCHP